VISLAEGAPPGSESAGNADTKRRKTGKKRGIFIAVLFGIFPPIVYHVVPGEGMARESLRPGVSLDEGS
jgi:hypothetical protein